MKVIIAGSRSINDQGYLNDIYKAVILSDFILTEVVSGMAAGVDMLGELYAVENNIPVARFPADWKNIDVPGAIIKQNMYGKYNAVAGHMRNKEMAEYADALIAVWDGKSKGTKNMLTIMKKMKKPVFLYNISTQ